MQCCIALWRKTDSGIVRDGDVTESMVIHFINRVPASLVEQFRSISSATVYEASGRRGALSSRIKAIDVRMKVCGAEEGQPLWP